MYRNVSRELEQIRKYVPFFRLSQVSRAPQDPQVHLANHLSTMLELTAVMLPSDLDTLAQKVHPAHKEFKDSREKR